MPSTSGEFDPRGDFLKGYRESRPTATKTGAVNDEAVAFEREIAAAINRHSIDAAMNTPDFVLARFVVESLKAFDTAMKA